MWNTRQSMQEKRKGAAASMTDRGLFVTGGRTTGRNNRLSSTEYFTSDGWVSGPSLPVAMDGHCQVTVGGLVIVTGKYSVMVSSGNMVIYRRI